VLCRISSPSLAGVLSRMEEFGYIKRKRLDHDQRRLRVSLTARSRALAGRMAPQIEATYRQIEAAIGTEFSTRFYQALDELIGALGPLCGKSTLQSVGN
jgi:DNA-binding MarR family transcriptional regulator